LLSLVREHRPAVPIVSLLGDAGSMSACQLDEKEWYNEKLTKFIHEAHNLFGNDELCFVHAVNSGISGTCEADWTPCLHWSEPAQKKWQVAILPEVRRILSIGELHRCHAECIPKATALFGKLHGWNKLHSAAFNGQAEVARRVLESENGEVNALATDSGYSALHLAAGCGHFDVIRELLQNETLEVNLPCRTGETPLHLAAYFDHPDVVRQLLGNVRDGVNVLIGNNDKGCSPLHTVAHFGDADVVRQVFQKERKRLQVNVPCTAAQNGHVDMMMRQRLQAVQVNEKASDGVHGLSALHIAAKEGHSEVVRQLLQVPAVEVNALDRVHGLTAVQTAGLYGHRDVLKLLLPPQEV